MNRRAHEHTISVVGKQVQQPRNLVTSGKNLV